MVVVGGGVVTGLLGLEPGGEPGGGDSDRVGRDGVGRDAVTTISTFARSSLIARESLLRLGSVAATHPFAIPSPLANRRTLALSV